MSDVVLKRWVRYGHDRLYVQTADGHRLGYWDNNAGTAQVQDDAHKDAFFTALVDAGVINPAPQPAAVEAVPEPCEDSDIDHVVIGAGGVYTINAKNHPDARITKPSAPADC